jgi:nitrite reductase/ring-hydroxylating ferredoxin subunit
VLHYREPARAFAMRFDGKVVAYLNRCVHVPTELDWQPGEFLDSGKEFILCSIHWRRLRAAHGHCIGGPCGRGKLTRSRSRSATARSGGCRPAATRPVPRRA